MPHIYSTLTCDQLYPVFAENPEPGSPNVILAQVLIKGGANVARARFDVNGTYTPAGIHTEVTDEQLEILFQNDQFQKHVDGGFLTLVQSKEKVADIVKDMEKSDASAPYTPADYEKGGRAQKDPSAVGIKLDAPTVGPVDEDNE